MRAAYYFRTSEGIFAFLLPEDADKLRAFFAEHQNKALDDTQAKPSSAE